MSRSLGGESPRTEINKHKRAVVQKLKRKRKNVREGGQQLKPGRKREKGESQKWKRRPRGPRKVAGKVLCHKTKVIKGRGIGRT